MTVSKIVQLGNDILRQQAIAVDNVHSPTIKEIIETMKCILANTQGVGIAAPQIGESQRIIIVGSRPTSRYPNAPLMAPLVMINPSFQALSTDKAKDWEGCLSIPGIRALVPRYRKIHTRYVDPQGVILELRLEGFIARIFQHECDHLDGKVFLDNVETADDIFSEKEYLKQLDSVVTRL